MTEGSLPRVDQLSPQSGTTRSGDRADGRTRASSGDPARFDRYLQAARQQAQRATDRQSGPGAADGRQRADVEGRSDSDRPEARRVQRQDDRRHSDSRTDDAATTGPVDGEERVADAGESPEEAVDGEPGDRLPRDGEPTDGAAGLPPAPVGEVAEDGGQTTPPPVAPPQGDSTTVLPEDRQGSAANPDRSTASPGDAAETQPVSADGPAPVGSEAEVDDSADVLDGEPAGDDPVVAAGELARAAAPSPAGDDAASAESITPSAESEPEPASPGAGRQPAVPTTPPVEGAGTAVPVSTGSPTPDEGSVDEAAPAGLPDRPSTERSAPGPIRSDRSTLGAVDPTTSTDTGADLADTDTGDATAAAEQPAGGELGGDRPAAQVPGSAAQGPTDGEVQATSPARSGVTPAVQSDGLAVGLHDGGPHVDATSADGGPVTVDPLWNQIRRALGSLRTLPSGEQVVTIRLRPAELGSVLVRINTGEAGTTVSLVAETSAAANQLNQQRQQLIRELEDGGLVGVDVDIDLDSGSDADRGPADTPDGQVVEQTSSIDVRLQPEGDRSGYRTRRGHRSTAGLVDVDL